RRRELLLELLRAAERVLDEARELERGLPAAGLAHAFPVERVVPGLRGVVEDLRVLGIADGGGDHLLERHVGIACAGDELVQLRDVRGMVLAVVKRNGLGGDDGFQRIFLPRKRRELEGSGRFHHSSLGSRPPRGKRNWPPAPVGAFRRAYQRITQWEFRSADRS